MCVEGSSSQRLSPRIPQFHILCCSTPTLRLHLSLPASPHHIFRNLYTGIVLPFAFLLARSAACFRNLASAARDNKGMPSSSSSSNQICRCFFLSTVPLHEVDEPPPRLNDGSCIFRQDRSARSISWCFLLLSVKTRAVWKRSIERERAREGGREGGKDGGDWSVSWSL